MKLAPSHPDMPGQSEARLDAENQKILRLIVDHIWFPYTEAKVILF